MKRILFRIVLLFAASCVTPLDGAEPVLGQTARQESAPEDENLKSMLRREFMVDHDVDVVTEDWSIWSEGVRFKKDTNISDERFHAVLIDIYREAEATIQARNQESQDMQVLKNAERWMRGAVFWLGACEDVASKTFLLDLASDTSKGGTLRVIAISSYLHVADAEEAKGALLRFLVSPDRMTSDMDRSGVYAVANTAWNESSPEKKLAICEALQVGLSHETTHWVFRSGDGWLCEMSPAYAKSKERLVLLERMLAQPFPERRERTKLELESRLEAMYKLKKHTSVNTNLATAIAHDFSQPLQEEERMALETLPDALDTTDAAQEKSTETGRKSFYALAAVAGLLGVLALWFGLRRKRGSA